MKRNALRTPSRCLQLVGLAATITVCLLSPPATAAEKNPEPSLYMWTDQYGVVRYTTSPGRVPRGAQETMVRVVPGMPALAPTWNIPEPDPLPPPPPGSLAGPGGAVLAASLPPSTFGATPSVEAEPPGPEPFNQPDQARVVEELPVAGPVPAAAVSTAIPEPVATNTAPLSSPPAPTASAAPAVAAGPVEEARTEGLTQEDLDARIGELRSAIARDEEALRELISSEDPDGVPLRDSPELREIARRLPAEQAELWALEKQRAGGGS